MSRIVTFGETMLRLTPPDNRRLEVADRLDVQAAGAESNAAVAASRVGADATWLSKLPAGVLGDRVLHELHRYGIDTAVTRSDGDRQGVYFVEQGGQPRGVNVVYDRSDAAVTTATAAELPTDVVGNADVFFTTGITPALSDQLHQTTETLLSEAAAAGMTTAFDLNYRSKLWDPDEAKETIEGLLQHVSCMIVAERDAKEVLDVDGAQASQIAHAIAREYDPETVVLTRGDKGAVGWHDNVVHEQPAFQADTVDPIGTGDAFAGAFLGRRVRGDDVPTALETGAAAAALKRTIPGDVLTARREEIDQVVQSGAEAIDR